MIKDTNEQPGEVVYKVAPGRVPNVGASVLVKLGTHPPYTQMRSSNPSPHQTHLGSSPNSVLMNFYGGSIM